MMETRLQISLCKKMRAASSMEMFGIQRKDLISEVEQIVGAAIFLEIAAKAFMREGDFETSC